MACGAAKREASAQATGQCAPLTQGLDFVQGAVSRTEGAVEAAHAIQGAQPSVRGVAGVPQVSRDGTGQRCHGAVETCAEAALCAGLVLLGGRRVANVAQVNVDATDINAASGNQVTAGSLHVALAGVNADVAIQGGHGVASMVGDLAVALFAALLGADGEAHARPGKAAAALLRGVAGGVGVFGSFHAHAVGAFYIELGIGYQLGANTVDLFSLDPDVVATQDAAQGDGVFAAGGIVAAAGVEQAAMAAVALFLRGATLWPDSRSTRP